MKIKVGDFIKTLAPATATTEGGKGRNRQGYHPAQRRHHTDPLTHQRPTSNTKAALPYYKRKWAAFLCHHDKTLFGMEEYFPGS